jgi:uncharacterized protein YabN with tetrapyrrole methylase and pyrophosphatase domain
MRKGSLTVVGSGIQSVGHVTLETQRHIEQADRVFHLLTDPVTEDWLAGLNPRAETLVGCYGDGKPRMKSYQQMVKRILAAVRKGQRVVAVFYGHPGVFVLPSHAAIRQARAEGYPARMLPGISAEDCLFADLGLDPAMEGCQSYEATDFLARRRAFDATSALVLWQIGVIADLTFQSKASRYRKGGLPILAEVLLGRYPRGHLATIYEAAQYPVCDPVMLQVPLSRLSRARVSPISTLYVPPVGRKPLDAAMLRRLGLKVPRRVQGAGSR